MGTYFLAIGIILLILLGWVAVQQIARLFAARHPEFGSYTEKVGCGGGCGCGGGSCSTSASEDGLMGRSANRQKGEPARGNHGG